MSDAYCHTRRYAFQRSCPVLHGSDAPSRMGSHTCPRYSSSERASWGRHPYRLPAIMRYEWTSNVAGSTQVADLILSYKSRKAVGRLLPVPSP